MNAYIMFYIFIGLCLNIWRCYENKNEYDTKKGFDKLEPVNICLIFVWPLVIFLAAPFYIADIIHKAFDKKDK